MGIPVKIDASYLYLYSFFACHGRSGVHELREAKAKAATAATIRSFILRPDAGTSMRLALTWAFIGAVVICYGVSAVDQGVKPESKRPDGPPPDPEEPDPFGEGTPFELTDEDSLDSAKTTETSSAPTKPKTSEIEHEGDHEKMSGMSSSDTKAVMPKRKNVASFPKAVTMTPNEEKEEKVASSTETTALPEPAIKFDNIQEEDYGDEEEKEKNAKPDEINTEVIEQLVNKFLNNGSIADGSAPKFANPAVQALVGGEYWEVDGLEEPGSIKDQHELTEWLDGYQREAVKVLREVAAASWRYFSNASPMAKQALNEAENVLSKFVRATSRQAKQFDMSSVTDPAIKKQLQFVSFEGMTALAPKKYNKFNEAQANLNRLAADLDVCDVDAPPPCALKRIDLQSIFASEKNAMRLAHLWVSYVKAMAVNKNAYQQLVELSNEGAKANGFADAGEMWRSAFDMATADTKPVFDLRAKLHEIYAAMRPLYEQLHAYFRRHLAGIYENPSDITKGGPIPAHLFGSIEGNDWSVHFEQTKPYEEVSQVPEDMLDAFKKQNYTSKQIFIKAYRYFKSIGFPKLPKTFWTNSIFARVWSRDMICNPPAAVDMRDGRDYRVKVCAQLGEPDFELAHSLMVQTYYQLSYKQQPLLFRESASPVISEGIAKVFSRLATNPHYLYSQELVPSEHLDIKDSLVVNRLYREALSHIPQIPFSLAADEWRYELFEGKIPEGTQNDRWWQLRTKYEGVKSPQPYNSSVLDALMHSAIFEEHSPATRNTISYVVQFQILKALCPEGTILSEGCILSEDTTTNLREAMKQGSSANWMEALKIITGKSELDVQPMLEYFEPLMNWLRNTNEVDQVIIGWENSDGARFDPEELPKPVAEMDGGTGILSEDRIAYPGGDCTGGQECLLDSSCNGTVCVCNEGLFTLIIGNTFNCVPGNPADSGFGDGKVGKNHIYSFTTKLRNHLNQHVFDGRLF
ncbi:hypothetical protein WR25_19575 isoform B [Diploscapter pachys]|uniref:Angiotensin-converting enzyme n=2 Tax=Diploscapter pachys TaxID=2018661 RepID=A0A2A2LC12_9BILA|nr:hypothetical protein WR25_19575 isoform B [Diploscapter pachys]